MCWVCTVCTVCTVSTLTHHSDGEVVVHDAVRHRIPSLLLVGRRDINLPAIQHHLGAVLHVPQDFKKAFALVASEQQERRDVLKSASNTCTKYNHQS